MSIKLKVIKMEDTPKNCKRRVVLRPDYSQQEWVRDCWEMTFRLWSRCRSRCGDTVYDPVTKTHHEVDSPFEAILDEDGCETGEQKLKDGLLAFPVDIIEHGGTAWALGGEGGPGFYQPFDTTRGAFWLYVDKDRWERCCGNCEWKFVDGEPTEELLKAAHDIAASEIRMMNLSEEGSYYRYQEQVLVHELHDVHVTAWDGKVSTEKRETDTWEDADNSCGGCLTEEPALDMDFPAGRPVVTDDRYLVGDTFEQECWAFSDDITGKFVRFSKGSFELVDSPQLATLYSDEMFPSSNRKVYEADIKRALTVVDVTKEVWDAYPECHA